MNKALAGAAFALCLCGGEAAAATTCQFETSGLTMTLLGDCTTDATIVVPDGMTLDGANHTITAVDPPGDHFRGAVVLNGGESASVINTRITVSNLANVCDAGGDRLRGIMLERAGGLISGNVVIGLNQGPSGCQEGNAIEVRNFTDAIARHVEIAHNQIDAYQKSGIVTNGAVDASIHHNKVGASATQANLAANAVQVGFGARATVEHNQIDGNSWAGADAAATAVLLFEAAANTVVAQNNLGGNADIGIYVEANSVIVDNNRVYESGPDGFYDVGIGNYGVNNVITNNKVRGYDVEYEDLTSP